MALASGTHVGPYEVIASAGSGGMGEVYRARDSRLNRDVALKVLPEAFARDPERLRRFQQEAQAVAALNHPNILSIHDFGAHEGAPYIVTEFLEGETLRERVRPGALPVRKAVDTAEQIARGLAAAHEKGIVHRDLKPENIFVTRDGRVKILDFGLAKLTLADGAPSSEAATMASQTEPGMVMGTVGYMSPEQVKGRTADHRSDLFSFGTILYEMLSGKRAFERDSSVESMNAILKEDPPELTEANRTVPPALDRIVRHCLEKNPDERFQSARDVAFNLTNLSALSGTSAIRAVASGAGQKRRNLWPVAVGLALLCAVAAYFFGVQSRPAAETPVFHTLTFDQGTINSARFSQDGHTVVYSGTWEDKPARLFMTRTEFAQPQALAIENARVVSVSPTNEIAFIEGERPFSESPQTLKRAPVTGGAPREVLTSVRDAAWGPDGNLAVVHQVNGRDRLEYPIGKVLYDTAGWVSQIRFSRGGDKIAFLDHVSEPDTLGSVAMVDLQGHKQTLTKVWGDTRGLAWSADGKEIWFAAAELGAEDELRAVTLAGKVRTVYSSPVSLLLQDISADGKVLVSWAQAKFKIASRKAGEDREQNLSWYDYSILADIAPDGSKISFVEQGAMGGPHYSVAVRGLDGSDPVRLGEGYAGGISSDGRWVLSFLPGPPPKMTMLPTAAGEPQVVPLPGLERVVDVPFGFFPDGKRVWFTGAEANGAARTYMQETAGGTPRAVTPKGVYAEGVSPDGKFLVGPGEDGILALFPVDGGAAKAIPGMPKNVSFAQWTADGRSIYVAEKDVPSTVWKIDLANGNRTQLMKLMPADPAGVAYIVTVALSRDGKTYAYSYRRILSSLQVVEGLK